MRLSREARRRIAGAAEAAYPAEACGFLVGRAGAAAPENAAAGEGVTIVRVAPAPNRAERPDRFFIDARDVWEAMRAARDAGEQLLGVYHSHPDGDARPSSTDLDDAWGEWLHVIVACEDGVAREMRAWRFRDGRFRPLEIQPHEDEDAADMGGPGRARGPGDPQGAGT